MLQRSFRRVFLFAFLPLSGYLTNTSVPAESSEVARSVDFRTSGIRFQIAASIKADSASSYATQHYNHGKASLAVKIRISAHARESNFFGEVGETISNFLVNEGSPEKLFWQDSECHQRRGLPKTTVTAVEGTMAGENGKVSINARPRHLGMLLPSDEISAGTRLPDGADKNRNFIAYRSQTKLSHLFVDVKVYLIDCDLMVGAPPMIPANRQPR
jgi:hypothetical protein